MTVVTAPAGFARQLKRWRLLRRVSQLDLAIRAGTTQRYLSYLEQGRSQPGRAMVVRLAESLALSLRDRNGLLLAAGYAPVFPETALDAVESAPAGAALHAILQGHMPYPAVIVRPHGVLVAANPAFGLITEGAAPWLLEPPLHVLRLALHPEGLAPRVVNLAEWGRHITEALRARAAAGPDAALDDLLAELESYLPPPQLGPGHIGFAVPLRLRTGTGELSLITMISSFTTAVDITLAELQLEAFLPADETTAQILRDRAERVAGIGRPTSVANRGGMFATEVPESIESGVVAGNDA
ncbi:helix-turn-helix domain-containing protein [Nocardia sp. NPDC051750]|uniref:helix-turn-helix domain-containing protein n=1 Tax=Nocardia sp. NPDC051750 TaxID=3364325 RepID=UPI0037AA5BCE